MRPASVEGNPRRHGPPRGDRVGLFIVVLVLAILGAVAYFVGPMIFTIFTQDQLAEEGVPAPARILSVRETNTRVNHRWVYELSLEVFPEGKDAYETTVSQPLSNLHAANLRPGLAANVRYDAEDPTAVVVMSTGGPLSPRAGQTSGSTRAATTAAPAVDPICQKAADCCKKIADQSSGANCDGFLSPVMPAESCKAALSGFKQAAEVKKVVCD